MSRTRTRRGMPDRADNASPLTMLFGSSPPSPRRPSLVRFSSHITVVEAVVKASSSSSSLTSPILTMFPYSTEKGESRQPKSAFRRFRLALAAGKRTHSTVFDRLYSTPTKLSKSAKREERYAHRDSTGIPLSGAPQKPNGLPGFWQHNAQSTRCTSKALAPFCSRITNCKQTLCYQKK